MISGAVWSAVRSWGTRATTLLVFIVLARLLSPQDIGVLALLLANIGLVQIVAQGGMSDFIVQEPERDRSREAAIFWFQLASALGLAVMFALLAAPLANFMLPQRADGTSLMLAMAALIPLSTLAKVPEAIMRKELRFKPLALRTLFVTFTGGITGIALALCGFGVWALVAKVFVETIVDALVVNLITDWAPFTPFDRTVLYRPGRFGGRLMLGHLMDALSSRADALIIGALLGTTALGFYSVGQRLYFASRDLLTSMAKQISLPYLSKVKASPAEFRKVVLQLIAATSMVSIPFFLMLSVMGRDLVVLLFGSRWEPSASLLTVFALCGVPFALINFLQTAPLAMGASGTYSKLITMTTLGDIVAYAVGASIGLIAVPLALLARTLLTLPIICKAGNRYVKASMTEYVQALRPAVFVGLFALAALVIAVHLLQSTDGTSYRVAVEVAVFTLALLIAIRLYAPGIYRFVRELRKLPERF